MADANRAFPILDGNSMTRSHSLSKYRNIGIMAHIDAGKQQRQKEYYITQGNLTKLVKFMTVPQQWIGWNKNKSVALQLHLLQQLVFGKNTELI